MASGVAALAPVQDDLIGALVHAFVRSLVEARDEGWLGGFAGQVALVRREVLFEGVERLLELIGARERVVAMCQSRVLTLR